MIPPYYFNLDPLEKRQLRQISARWQRTICSIKPLNRDATYQAITSAYQWLGHAAPEIIFVDSPQAALNILLPVATHISGSKWGNLFQIFWCGLWVFSTIFFCVFALLGPLLLLAKYFVFIDSIIEIWFQPKIYGSLSIFGIIVNFFLILVGQIVWILVALAVFLWILKKTSTLMNTWECELLDRPFRKRFGCALHDDFRQKLWRNIFISQLDSISCLFARTFHSPKVETYGSMLQDINRQYTESLPIFTALRRDFPDAKDHTLFLLCDNYQNKNIDRIRTFEFQRSRFPQTDEFRDWWKVYRDLAANCHLIVPYSKVCLICDRPAQVQIDNNGILHAIAQPAWVYRDGSAWYFYRGVALPPLYGAIHPQEWQREWIDIETNRQIRQLLIEEMDAPSIQTLS